MKSKFAALALLALLSAGLISASDAQAANKKIDQNTKIYYADLNGDGRKEMIEIEDRSAKDAVFILSVGNRNRNKTMDLIDGLVISGKIRKIELVDLNDDGQMQIVVYFDDLERVSNIIVYQLKNNKLYKIFSAASEYGVAAEFETIPRIKVGKPSKYNNSSNFLPDWDSWVWLGDKFVKD